MIDKVDYLLDLNSDELTELMLDDKYSKAYLRELIRRILKVTKNYRDGYLKLKGVNFMDNLEMEFCIGDIVFADIDSEYGCQDDDTYEVVDGFIEKNGTHVYIIKKENELYEVYPASMVKTD